MGKIDRFWVFIIIQDGVEKVMAWPDSAGREMPLLYLDEQRIVDFKMKEAMQKYSDTNQLFIELREYQVVPSSIEKFYPSKSNYNA